MRADQIIVTKNFIAEGIGASEAWAHSTKLSDRTHITDDEGRELAKHVYIRMPETEFTATVHFGRR